MRNVEQGQDSAEKVQAMCRGQDIKEAAAWIGDEKNALTRELTPSKELTCQKQDAQTRSYAHHRLKAAL